MEINEGMEYEIIDRICTALGNSLSLLLSVVSMVTDTSRDSFTASSRTGRDPIERLSFMQY
jgi:hypothetical protein